MYLYLLYFRINTHTIYALVIANNNDKFVFDKTVFVIYLHRI